MSYLSFCNQSAVFIFEIFLSHLTCGDDESSSKSREPDQIELQAAGESSCCISNDIVAFLQYFRAFFILFNISKVNLI